MALLALLGITFPVVLGGAFLGYETGSYWLGSLTTAIFMWALLYTIGRDR